MQNTPIPHVADTSPWSRTAQIAAVPAFVSKSRTKRGNKEIAAMAAAGSNSSDHVPILQAENLTSNVKSIYYSRTFLSIIGGVVAGIWGFTGLMGFVFYFLVMMVASLGLLAKSKFSVYTYFDNWGRILIEGVFGGLMSFVLFWTVNLLLLEFILDTSRFAYDIVHIF